MITIRNALAVTTMALVVAACGGGSSGQPETPVVETPTTEPVGPAGLVFLADGTTLHAATIASDGYSATGSAAIPPAGLDAEHQIFSLVVHPGKQWVYAASSARYGDGNARLSRFAVDWETGALRYVDSTLMTATGPRCAATDDCTPVGLGMTADGKRLIVEENVDNAFLTYAVAADGSLSFLTETPIDTTDNAHGVGINASGTYVYHGSMAYSRTGNLITPVGNVDGIRGNASVVLQVGGAERLYTTLRVDEIAVLSLADPAAPALIASLDPEPTGGESAVFMDVTRDGKRILAVGDDSVAIVDFDGAALAVKHQIAPGGRARGAAFNADASLAVVSFQTGGARLYTVATDGTLEEIGMVPSSNPTRAVVFATRP